MVGEWIDRVARGVANGYSRREMLRLAAGGVALAALVTRPEDVAEAAKTCEERGGKTCLGEPNPKGKRKKRCCPPDAICCTVFEKPLKAACCTPRETCCEPTPQEGGGCCPLGTKCCPEFCCASGATCCTDEFGGCCPLTAATCCPDGTCGAACVAGPAGAGDARVARQPGLRKGGRRR